MNENTKITPDHLRRCALVYVRQSSPAQVQHNRESTELQYNLVDRAVELGWKRDNVNVVDQDTGISSAGFTDRSGFESITAKVGLGQVGIVLGIEVSRLARNNADWYRLLDLCGVTDTLIGDGDGIYHPGLFNDRLVLGLKGTMSEAELHVLRARLHGGIRNKAARGHLRCGLPIGLVWGDDPGEIRFHPDEAIIKTIRTVFARFAEMGSVRQVWLSFRSQKLRFPLSSPNLDDVRWVAPTYTKIRLVLTNPVYAGAYVYGKTRHERYVDQNGRVRKRARRLPRSEWAVLLCDHHEGFIDWETFVANQARIARNIRPRPHQPGGAVREGTALLQGIATCGHCGRRLSVYYSGRHSTPGYHCPGDRIVNGKGEYCLRVGGLQIDTAVATTFLAALAPAGMDASLRAAQELQADRDAVLAQRKDDVERACYEAHRAERRYRAVDPLNRLVARGLEAEWEKCLQALDVAQAELARCARQQPRPFSAEDRKAVLSLGSNLEQVWSAPTTMDRDRKELLRTLLQEVAVTLDKDQQQAHLTLRWHGGLLSDLEVSLRRSRPAPIRTDEETLTLMRRLAAHYSDAVIAGILNRQGRTTATGMRFTPDRVCTLRNHWDIPRFEQTSEPADGEVVNVYEAAEILGVAPSTVHRWLNVGFIAAEQITPGAPWRIRITDDLRSRFLEQAPEGYLPMLEATRILGVSRQTVLQRVKRHELDAVHVRCGRRKGLRIKVPTALPSLFDSQPTDGGVV
jgi:DNA invertase Pin-like site-specific DNA recombinase